MRSVLKVVDAITLVLSILAAFAIVIMMVQVTLDVVMELLFNKPLPATLTLVAKYYMPMVTFLPLVYVERLNQHVAADVVTQFLPMRGQKHLAGWIFLLSAAVCALLTYATWVEAVDKFHTGSFAMERNMKVPIWPVRFAAPASYGLLTLLFVLKFIAYIARSTAFEDKRHPFPGFTATGGYDE
ncbi:TRAP-type C4-dicarboxylate transport system permease small subunit [Maritimibacter alkaliphilus HTCC2654]|jgi:TRAP-type C4-dicarboxylate transport system permease small subunit|uniref:TRAP transporter small permease protein n=1 Tax=Maritimibacter alkaliphilus HTCC2654 TaxID=314271 RepID=A3VKA1_9RHOB|nr:TRAP-T family transporter, DctQ (4 TMs) subunit [Rhodobacterales bacterium HTCC2654] [Maritimibacter alkaliphilus HTCC2654]TYP80112.1 TRAP-type C4-dicarboxylate transport system permease small subunit [Maritimibacter alkaliphilus HTCC2654]